MIERLGEGWNQNSKTDVSSVGAHVSGHERCVVSDIGKTWRLPRVESIEDGISEATRDQKENTEERSNSGHGDSRRAVLLVRHLYCVLAKLASAARHCNSRLRNSGIATQILRSRSCEQTWLLRNESVSFPLRLVDGLVA